MELDPDSHGWRPIRCPFHDDRAASASYNTVIERFRCHACGMAGDGYGLIMEVDRCDFLTAKTRAAEVCGVSGFSTEPTAQPGRSRLTAKRSLDRSRLIRQKYGRK